MDNFSVFIDQTVGVWQIIKYVLMFGALVYLVVMGVSWDRRLLGGLALSALVFLLAGCTVNAGATPADARIAASQADIAQVQANAQAQQQQALLAAQAQQQQATALQVAQANAQEERNAAIAQQAAENALQAQANAQQAAVMSNAIAALDNANARAAERSTWLGWLLVAIVAGVLVIGGMAVYWRGKVAVASVQAQPVQRPALPPLNDAQLLDIARAAGYLIEKTAGGWQVVNPATNQLVSKTQLLLEVQP